MTKPTKHQLGLIEPLLKDGYAPGQILLGRVQFAGKPVSDVRDVFELLRRGREGDEARIQFRRSGRGGSRTFEDVLKLRGAAPDDADSSSNRSARSP